MPMKTVFHFVVVLCCLSLVVACGKDVYHFPDASREFFTAYTASDSTIQAIELDNGAYFKVIENTSNRKGTPDSVYRFIGYYEVLDEGVKLYSANRTVSSLPVPLAEIDSLCTDPLDMVSIWKSGRFLNMRLALKHGNGEHEFGFAEDSIRQMKGQNHLWFSFQHFADGDMEAFTDFVYASIPLKAYLEKYKKFTLHFSLNTHEGMKQYDFDF